MTATCIAIAALLAGLAATPAWAQDIECPNGTIPTSDTSGVTPCSFLAEPQPKTNLDAAWRACQDRTTADASPVAGNRGFVLNYKWTATLQAPCTKIEALINASDKRRMDEAAAKEAAQQEAQDKAALVIIERGIADPDGKPK